ncbi:MAG: bifunctional metallophosphatase/5'-nucleotidase [Christensenellales bacterium]
MQDETGDKLYAAVQSAVDAARAEGATYVVAMGHMGIEESCSPYMSTEVITHTTGIDAFLDGHAHETMACNEVKNAEGKTVLRAACGTKLSSVGYLRIAKDGKLTTGLYTWTVDIAAPKLLNLTGDAADAVAAQVAKLDEIRQTVVATSQVPLYVNDPVAVTAEGTPVRIVRNAETNLGDLCADAYRALSNADIAFVNGGGIRKQIEAGDITLDDIYSVHPFGNTMCVIRVTGQQVLDALEWGARAVPSENGGFLQVSGLTYEIHTGVASSAEKDENGMFTRVSGEYRVKNVMVGGQPLELDKTYTLASHNYMLLGHGDGYTMFDGCEVLGEDMMVDNQVLITYITTTLGGVVGEQYANPYGDGRIVAVE